MARERVRGWRSAALGIWALLLVNFVPTRPIAAAILGGEEGVVFRDHYASFLSLAALMEFVAVSPAAPQTQMLQLAFESLELCRIRTSHRTDDAGYAHHFDFRVPGSRNLLLYRVSVAVADGPDSGLHVVGPARARFVFERRVPGRAPIRSFEDFRVLAGVFASTAVRDHVQAKLAAISELAQTPGEVDSSLVEVSLAPSGTVELPPLDPSMDYDVGFHWFGFEGRPGTESHRFVARLHEGDRSVSVWPTGAK